MSFDPEQPRDRQALAAQLPPLLDAARGDWTATTEAEDWNPSARSTSRSATLPPEQARAVLEVLQASAGARRLQAVA